MRTCSIEGCTFRHLGNGLCSKHWQERKRRRKGVPERNWRDKKRDIPCKIDGCGLPRRSLGLCNAHYLTLRRNGEPNIRLIGKRGNGSISKLHGYRILSILGQQVKEQRWVMEKHLGRSLSTNESVHHITE